MIFNNYGDMTEYFSFNSSGKILFNSENLIYENNDLFDTPKSQSELDSVDYQGLYFTNNNTEKKSEENKTLKKPKKINLNLVNITQRSTSNTLNRNIILQKTKKNEKIFDIKKTKHLGRKRKNQKSTEKSIHTKFTKDNIMEKIRRDVLDNTEDFLNSLLEETDNTEIKGITLKKIDTSILLNSKKEKNERILKMTLKELFSHNICKKYKYFPEDYNKMIIDKIVKLNDHNLNEALDTSFEYMIKLYSEEIIEDNVYKKFKRVSKNEKLFKNESNYIDKYKNILGNFSKEFDKIIPRSKKQSSDSK